MKNPRCLTRAKAGFSVPVVFLTVSGFAACSDTPTYVPDYRVQELEPEPVLGQPRIAFSSTRDRLSYVYVADADGSHVTRLVQGSDPAWSGDGRYLAYTSGEWIYRVRFDGSDRRRLVRGWHPVWSPDGRVGYLSYDGIGIVDAQGTSPRVVVRPGQIPLRNCGDIGLTAPTWSPDGREIAFLAGPGTYYETCEIGRSSQLFIVSLDTGEARAVSGSLDLYLSWDWSPTYPPAWSADGTRVAVPMWEAITVVDVSSGEQSAVSFPPGVGGLDWSPDGRHIVFSGGRDGTGGRIFGLSLDSGVIDQLIPDAPAPLETFYGDSDPSWARLVR